MSLLPNQVYTVGYLFIEDDEAVVSPCRSACLGCINSHEEKKAWKKNSQPTSGPLNGFFFPLLAFDVLGFADLWLISRNKACLFWLMLVDQVRSNLHYLSFASDHIEELILIKHALDHQFSWTESPEEKLSTTFRTLMAFFSLLGFDLWRFADLWLIDITSTKLVCFFLMLVDKVRSQSTWSEFCFRS